MNQLLRFLFLLLAFQIAVSSCASTKKRDDQSALGKLWHNMNSHYNGYFNAREIMTETLLEIDENHTDNYTQRLKMFPFLELQNTSGVAEQLDVAVEKVAIVVKKHPYSNWVDDSYLLIGQSQLIKQDYESAEKTLRFMVNEFRPRPKRKKSKGRKGAKESEPEEEEFISRRKVESNPTQDRKDRLRARKEAQKERQRLSKEREKAAKARKKQRDKERKARIKARKRGIKLPPRTRPDTSAVAGLENEPDAEEQERDLGPVGMISIFSNGDARSGNGEPFGKKPDSYLTKHRPAFQEGRLWLAWTLIKRDNFDRAQIILDDLRADRGTFPDVRRKAMAVQAFLYLEQEELELAIPFLEEAAEVARERNERARFHYIAGQLYQELGQPAGAAGAFEKTIAARPDYELELGARLNLAQNGFLSGSGSAADALKKLGRMAKEEKNLPYESQILFSMASVALRSGDKEAGAKYLEEALASPSAGPTQQLEAYKTLADMAYQAGDYLAAKNNYDQALNIMEKSDSRYAAINERRESLTGVAEALTDIQLKDSLLRIGMLPEAERQQWAKDLFEKQRADALAPRLNDPEIPGRPGAPALGGSDYWAYSSQSIKRGKRDFERTWGERPLDDNWRRSRRTDSGIFDDPDDATAGLTEEVTIVTEDEINRLLEGIPTTDAELSTMNIQQATNYFNLGREYRDRLRNNEQSLDAFGALNTKYPKANGEAESWYYQYLIHKEKGNQAKATEFAVKLSGSYPGTKYTRLANEPGYAATLLADDNKLTRDYEAAYAAFQAGDFKTANDMAQKGRATLIGQHPLKSRYALLLAMTTGNLQGRQAYINSLRQVVSQFSGTPEETRAKEILRLLGESGARVPGQAGGGIVNGGGFKESMKELHYVLVVFRKNDMDLNAAKISVSKFNTTYNKTDRLRVTNVYLGADTKTPVLVMRRFKNGAAAMEYLSNARERETEFLDGGKFNYDIYAVSQSNYREVLKARTVEGYKDWFEENY